MRTSTRMAILISMVLTVLLAALLGYLTVIVRPLVALLLDVGSFLTGAPEPETAAYAAAYRVLLLLAYCMIAAAFAALAGLFLLLRTILRGRVFSRTTLGCLLTVALCCFLEAALMAWSGRYFISSFLGAAVFVLIGLCLTVVRTVIAEAMRIKQENDLTV